MNRIFFIILIVFPMFASAQTINVNTKKGTVNFTYDGSTEGTLGDVSATIKFDVSNLSAGTITGTVNVSTLDTGIGMRNKHLSGKSYFDTETYPTMKFTSSSISQSGENYVIKGKLKIKATEKEVTFNAKNKDGKLIFTTTIYGLDFDVATSKKREKTKIDISVEIPM